MEKIFIISLGVFCWFNCLIAQAAEKFDILPDLPEPLQAAQATSITTTDTSNAIAAQQSIGHEPNIASILLSLIFVVLLIYATGIIYTRLNKFGMNTLKKQIGEGSSSKVSVVSTTPLGANKTLHVVELDGKRMLIGASQSSIHLIKDLGSFPPGELEMGEYSKIEIPNIRIPKIEIPKIEFPNIGFTKASPKFKTETQEDKQDIESNIEQNDKSDDGFEISGIYEEGPDGIIDRLFKQDSGSLNNENIENEKVNEHKVDPEEFALYKKYL